VRPVAFIANTDFGWFSHFLHRAEPPDEVDFWQPSPHGFKAIPPGAPFFFRVTRAMFEANLAEKLASPVFRSDVLPMLRAGDAYDVDAAGALVSERLISRLSGEPWRGRSTGEARERR